MTMSYAPEKTDINHLNKQAWANGAFHAGLEAGNVICLNSFAVERATKQTGNEGTHAAELLPTSN